MRDEKKHRPTLGGANTSLSSGQHIYKRKVNAPLVLEEVFSNIL
jgi:hypothetical protein